VEDQILQLHHQDVLIVTPESGLDRTALVPVHALAGAIGRDHMQIGEAQSTQSVEEPLRQRSPPADQRDATGVDHWSLEDLPGLYVFDECSGHLVRARGTPALDQSAG
jgi:hypothetical protein